MIKQLSIKSHGIVFTMPSEILMLQTCDTAYSGTHFVLGIQNLNSQYYFSILRKNGVVVSDQYMSGIYATSLKYKECSIEAYYNLRAFL
jgi:hypothetical protein